MSGWRHLPESPWAILGVAPSADEDEIRLAHRSLVLELHPDRHPDDVTTVERMKLVTWAFAVITDESQCAGARAHFHPQATAFPSEPAQWPSAAPARRRGADVHCDVEFAYADVQWGRMRVVSVPGAGQALVPFPARPVPEFEFVGRGEGARGARPGDARGDLLLTVRIQPPGDEDRMTILGQAQALLDRMSAEMADDGPGDEREAGRIRFELEQAIRACDVDPWDAVRWLALAQANVRGHS